MNPLLIAEDARQLTKEIETKFVSAARDSLWGDVHNLVHFALQGGFFSSRTDDTGSRRLSQDEITNDVLGKIDTAINQQCQATFTSTRKLLVKYFNSPEAQQMGQEIKSLKFRIAMRNRQIRDLRRELRR